MRRFLLLFLLPLWLPAQPPTLDKPPQDVDDALRARVTQFYDYYSAGKARRCEDLIVEESKDDFYNLNKPNMESFKINNIEYSDNFTKAKVVLLAKMPVLFPMIGAKIMEQPIASFWRQENGAWFWYYNKSAAMRTPFGDASRGGPKAGDGTVNPLNSPQTNLDLIQSALKVDRTRIDLSSGKAESVKVTSSLPGAASLVVECLLGPLDKLGLSAIFDKKDLKGQETATLTLTAGSDTRPGAYPLRIMVKPTGQILDLTVNVAH
ncbi:MAG TPA: hypothetical protein VGL72_23620 [Bryobacteraceae bacterium]|jgi:hypothetical protein